MVNPAQIHEIKQCLNCNTKHDGVCEIKQPHLGGQGGCIKCGSMQIYPWSVGDDYDDDWELFRCLNCGLIASETT